MGQHPAMRALRAAFPTTIPVLCGFSFLGIAYGLLMSANGFGPGWSLLTSIAVFAGSMQYVGVGLLAAGAHPLYVLAMTLIINARHLFYGLSMLERLKGSRFKPYLIFAMCDESFSILCSTDPPEGVDKDWFMLCVALLDQFYWVAASVLGGLLGGFIAFNTQGLDFVLTALFVVIFLNQWRAHKNRLPAAVGLGCTAVCLVVFGPSNFLLPSMAAILTVLTLLRRPLEVREGETA